MQTMPSSYLENFSIIKDYAMSNFPRSNFFLTESSYINDDFFKINCSLSKKRNLVIKKLKKVGIEVRNGYYSPNELPIFKKKYNLPNSFKLSRGIISLPYYEELNKKQIKYICNNLDQILS